jgi:hypothetical protein
MEKCLRAGHMKFATLDGGANRATMYVKVGSFFGDLPLSYPLQRHKPHKCWLSSVFVTATSDRCSERPSASILCVDAGCSAVAAGMAGTSAIRAATGARILPQGLEPSQQTQSRVMGLYSLKAWDLEKH